jgi:hypothetical protein
VRLVLEARGINTVSSAHDWALANGLPPPTIVQIVRSRPGSNISGARKTIDFDIVDRICAALGDPIGLWYQDPLRDHYFPSEPYADENKELYPAGPTLDFVQAADGIDDKGGDA